MNANEHLMRTLGKNVMRLRMEQELTKKTFSLMCGISRPTLNKIENGIANPQLSYVQRLGDTLCVEPVLLLLEPERHGDFERLRFLLFR